MTIRELIAKLQTFHPDQLVEVVVPDWDENGDVKEDGVYQAFTINDVTNFITDRECNTCPVEIRLGQQMSG